tara:strand:- start:1187 stop:1558 length:372 start_codon:yes stop_codon:yes gene_type:complete
MRSFRNNNRRSRYRSNGDRNFKRNGENHSFTSNANFQRKSPGRNNQNASKLIEKYTDLAREALSKGDKILSENYFQHADHFIRIQDEKEKSRIAQNDNSGKTSSEDHDKLEDQKSTEKTATSN